ncbi:MAG: trpE operon leader peptide TrpLE [Ensifer adhaerens]
MTSTRNISIWWWAR